MTIETLGIVAIGRNEGERLKLCLQSLIKLQRPMIYVDSASSDNSVSIAKDLGVAVHELDPEKPCSASRARREGFRHLSEKNPGMEFVFFVDGDCQVDRDWCQRAVDFLGERNDVAAVCGRRRELHPEKSVYNLLCDWEWDSPIGEAAAVGGDAVYRVKSYRDAGEFDATVPAGEEPELCKRIRDLGWKIWRIDAEMTRHDAAMDRFSQWWTRQIRTGYAGYDVERRFQIGIFDQIIKSAYAWVIGLPTLVFVIWIALQLLSVPYASIISGLAALIFFFAQVSRIAIRTQSSNSSSWQRFQHGFFVMCAKIPIALGAFRQIIESARGKQAKLVEYKTAESLRTQP